MYFSEWGIIINDANSLEYAINLVNLHNTSFLDPSKRIVVYSVFCNQDNVYMMIGNGGDPTLTSAFFAANNDRLIIHYPLKKPAWWDNESEREYIWNPDRTSPDCPHFPNSTDIF